MNRRPVVEIVTTSVNADIEFLQVCVKRFANLMVEVMQEPMAYNGMSLDIILSMLVFQLHCRPSELAMELRRLCDSMDKGEYKQIDAPRKN